MEPNIVGRQEVIPVGMPRRPRGVQPEVTATWKQALHLRSPAVYRYAGQELVHWTEDGYQWCWDGSCLSLYAILVNNLGFVV